MRFLSLRFQILLLVCGALTVFGQVAWFGFVEWDDTVYVVHNPVVRSGLGWEQFKWAFTTKYFGLWQPQTWLSYMLEVQLWGVRPGAFHLVNVLLHVGAAGFLLAMLRECGVSPIRAFFIVFIFALHPLRAESIAWVSERKDVLCVFWLAVCFWCHVRWVRGRRWFYFVASLVACLLAMLAKPLAVVTPGLLLVLDYWPLMRKDGMMRLLAEKAGYAAIALLGMAMAVIYNTGAEHTSMGGGILEITGLSRIWLVTHAVWIHAFNHFWPVNLAFFHPIELDRMWVGGLLGAGFIVFLMFLAYRQRSSRPWVTAGVLWYFIALAPASGLVQISHFAYADRYSYLPSVGLLMAVVMTLQMPARKRERFVTVSAIGLLLVLMVALAAWQVSHWRDSEALFQRALAINPHNHLAHLKLGEHYLARKRYNLAEQHARAAHNLQEGAAFQASQIELLGIIAYERKDYAAAKMYWHRALAFHALDQGLHYRLGTLALVEMDIAAALSHFETSLQGRVVSPDLWGNYGVALWRSGRNLEAEQAYKKALALDPKYLNALLNLAQLLENSGRREEAFAAYLRAIQLAPGDLQAVSGLSRTQGMRTP